MLQGTGQPQNFTHTAYRQHLDNGFINVTAVDDKQQIVYANQSELKFLGYEPDEYIGQSAKDFYRVTGAELPNGFFNSDIKDTEVSVLCRDGSYKCLLVNCHRFTDEHNLTATYIFNRDITGYKKMESLLSYLNMAAEELAQARDTSTALKKISDLIVPKFANWFTIDLLNNNALELLVLAHEDPGAVKWAHEFRKNNPTDLNSNQGTALVVRTGKPSFVPVITYEMIAAHIQDPEKLEAIGNVGIQSLITVAIFSKEKVSGAITFISTIPGKHYDEADLRFAQNLANHIGLALENARLNEAAAADIAERKAIEGQLKITQTQLRSALSSGLVGTWILQAEKDLVYLDESLARMFGEPYLPNGYKTEVLTDKITARGKEEADRRRNQAIAGGGVYETEYEVLINGQSKWFFVRGKNEVNEQNNTKYFSGVVVDITARRQAELALKQSEDLFKLIAETMPEKIFVTDEHGQISYYNPQWESFTGRSLEEIEQLTLTYFIHPDDLEKNLERWREVLKSGESFQYEHRFKSKEGEYRWHLTRALPLKDDSGKIAKWIGAITDIHDQKIKEQKKDEFISIASHELRTPLTTVKAFFQLAKKGLQQTDSAYGFIDKAGKQLTRLERLIADLLDVSKINAGKMGYNMQAFNFDAALAEAAENVQLASDTHKVVIEPAANITLNGDKQRIEQVIQNLLSNAIKYSPGKDKVVIRSELQGNNIVVSVQDFGIGIAAENLTDLFERFYRVDNTAMRFQGLGLGLFIASEIIKRHNGSFWIESELGKGSIFYFLLPLSGKQEFYDIATDGRTFYSGNFIDIKYNAEMNWLETDWKGYQNFESVKKGCLIMLDLLRQNNCKKVLNDNTHVLGSWSDAVDWGSEVWFPAMQQAGLQYFAWIYSASTFSRMSAKKSIDVILDKVTAQFFVDVSEAKDWLSFK